MSSHVGYVVEIKTLRKHPNADRLQIATFFGEDVCVSLEAKIGDIGIYFPSDLQLGLDFCINNHLLRELPDGTKDTGYLELNKRNVKAITLRGAKSYGIYLPISCLEFTGANISEFKIGDIIDTVNGIEICRKYIPRTYKTSSNGNFYPKKKRKSKTIDYCPTFKEHTDTEQLAYNLDAFKCGDEIEITLKMHGTSHRAGCLPVIVDYSDSTLCRIKNYFGKKFKKDYELTHDGKDIKEYRMINGTRRVIINDFENDISFYGDNLFREPHAKKFEGKLWKGETVYFEIVGYTDKGVPIMANGKTPKEYQKQYGEITEFSYGCEPPESECYVYRMTMTNIDGDVVEYTPEFMRYRCEQMGVKTVPVFWRGTIPENPGTKEDATVSAGEWIRAVAEQFYDGPDPIGGTHVREGVVIRILNRPKFTAFKHKNHTFKLIEGIIKESAEVPDMEEAQEVSNNG